MARMTSLIRGPKPGPRITYELVSDGLAQNTRPGLFWRIPNSDFAVVRLGDALGNYWQPDNPRKQGGPVVRFLPVRPMSRLGCVAT